MLNVRSAFCLFLFLLVLVLSLKARHISAAPRSTKPPRTRLALSVLGAPPPPQSCFVAWSGVSETSREFGLVLLVAAAAVHGLTLAACVEGVVIFRDGQVGGWGEGTSERTNDRSDRSNRIESTPFSATNRSTVCDHFSYQFIISLKSPARGSVSVNERAL